MLLSDFINLTQVHNFTVSAQDIFTFRSNADNETFCTVLLTSQVVLVQSLQPKGSEFESTCVVFSKLFVYLYLHLLLLFL